MSGSKVIFGDTKKAELTWNLDQSPIRCAGGSISLDWYRILPRDIRNWKFYNFTVEQKIVYKLLAT